LQKGGVHKKGEITLDQIISEIKKNPEIYKSGGLACFIGIVRGIDENGDKVTKLALEAYEEKANETLLQICNELIERDGIIDVHIHHIIDELDVSEDIVYVVVAGGHRQDLWSTLRDAVERFKEEAPIWKKEITLSGAQWIH
jgi:molybdopterin synthase catalytic subunit